MMALHFPILVNGNTIGSVYIQRQHDLIPGQPSEYQVEIEYPLGEEHSVIVYHTYEDGALVLIAKALAAVGVDIEEDSTDTNDTPNPGSRAALAAGCICPVLDNNHGKWAPYPPDGWWKRPDCRVHFADPSPRLP